MEVLQLIKSINPTNFIIKKGINNINTTISDDINLYDMIEIKLEYDNITYGICMYQASRFKGDVNVVDGYMCFGWNDRGVMQYNVKLKGTILIISGDVVVGIIKKLTINLYNYETINQNIVETRLITESSQLATIWADNLQVQKDILKELKNQNINLEIQGRFISQSSRKWAIDSVLGVDEYNQARLEILEEYGE